MEAKPWYKSKTLWFGGLYVLVGVAGVFGYASFQPDPKLVQVTEVVTGLLVIGLRLLTSQPLSK